MILITAKEDDAHAVRVAKVLTTRHGQEVFIFDTSKVPSSIALSGRYFNGSDQLLLIRQDGSFVNLAAVTAFWWRRPQPIAIDRRIIDPSASNFAYQECVSTLYGFLGCCEALWVNDVQSDAAAEYKPFQLKLAGRLGFSVPETLITTMPAEVLDFHRRHDNGVIYKALNQRGLIWRPTRRLREEDLEQLDNVRYAPVIFQPVVPGIRDVRATVIGSEIFAAEFDIEGMEEVDYRTRMSDIACRPHQLPATVEKQIRTLMADLGLEYGGVDFRLTPQGEYVFFEINTAGEFLYVEERTGQPITDALAAHLAGGIPANKVQKAADR